MKPAMLAVYAVVVARALATATVIAAAEAPSNPVARVVDLLQDLLQKLEHDADKDEELFTNYKCWWTTIRDTKTATNVAAKEQIKELLAHISDVENGKITFTSERSDLTEEVAKYKRDLANAAAIREKENGDYIAAKKELEQGIAALAEAVSVLKDGQGVSLIDQASQGRRDVLLARAVAMSRSVMNSRDARLLEHVLADEVPKADWKKLNRKATFKEKYVVRSGKILTILEDLHKTFVTGLDEAEKTESSAQATYDKLKASKESSLEESENALSELVQEMGARALSIGDAQAEADALTEQVTNDERFIAEAEVAFKKKEAEFEERVRVRNLEKTGIAQAIGVLHSDDARDHFKKVYTSQGYSLVQLSSVSNEHSQRLHRAMSALAAITVRGDSRLMALQTRLELASKSGSLADPQFEPILTAIDKMVARLQGEETDDLTKKESCEKELASTGREASVLSRGVDELTDEIAVLADKIKELGEKIEEQDKISAEIHENIAAMTRQREDENKAYAASKVDDQAGVEIIEKAITIISEMQASLTAGGSLLQRRLRGKAPPSLVAGEAPPPPPSTWEDPTYTGAQDEHEGIVSIMQMVKQDIEKDIATADAAEADAAAAFEKETGELKASAAAADAASLQFANEKAELQTQSDTKAADKTSKKGELDATMKEYRSLEPGCNFFLVNFIGRSKNRQTEIDGLQTAKAILQGAVFPA